MSPMKRQIFERVQRDSKVRECVDRIHHLCDIIYGNPGILNNRVTGVMASPVRGKDFLLDISNDPRSVGALSGVKILCIKSRARKRAEEHVHSLCDAFEELVGVVNAAHGEIIRKIAAQREYVGLKTSEKMAMDSARYKRSEDRSALKQQGDSCKLKKKVTFAM